MEPLEDSKFRPLVSARLLEVLVVEPERDACSTTGSSGACKEV